MCASPDREGNGERSRNRCRHSNEGLPAKPLKATKFSLLLSERGEGPFLKQALDISYSAI